MDVTKIATYIKLNPLGNSYLHTMFLNPDLNSRISDTLIPDHIIWFSPRDTLKVIKVSYMHNLITEFVCDNVDSMF